MLTALLYKCGTSQNNAVGVVRQMLSGGGGAADPHGHTECSGVSSSRPLQEKVEGGLNLPAGAVQCRPKIVKTRGLVPEVLHCPLLSTDTKPA